MPAEKTSPCACIRVVYTSRFVGVMDIHPDDSVDLVCCSLCNGAWPSPNDDCQSTTWLRRHVPISSVCSHPAAYYFRVYGMRSGVACRCGAYASDSVHCGILHRHVHDPGTLVKVSARWVDTNGVCFLGIVAYLQSA